MVAAVIEQEDQTLQRVPLEGPSRVKGLNLLDTQWVWLAQQGRAYRYSRSDLVRRGVELLMEQAQRHPQGLQGVMTEAR